MNPAVQALATLVERLMAAQWESPAALAAVEAERLHRLAEHVARQSPLIRHRMEGAGLRPADLATPAGLARMPLLRRRDIQGSAASLYCAEVPREHGAVHEMRTSGSTGEPVVVRRTGLTTLYWHALAMRELLWHERDFSLRYASIRPTVSEQVVLPNWGEPANLLYRSGPLLAIPITTEIGQQAKWLAEFSPHFLLSFPSVVDAIGRHLRLEGQRLPDLRCVKSIGETLSPRLRAEIETGFGVPVVDVYSSHEVGIIAVQCPESDLYHAMSENLVIEIVDTEGRACAPGEAGRVAITDLHNYATPILRYEIGDWAESGEPCKCGRGLPTIRRILGRERNLVLMPDGSRRYPLVGFARFREVAPVVQYQVVQHAVEDLEMRLVVEAPLAASQESDLVAIVREALGFSFALRFTYFPDRIPTARSGKFEEFVCRI
ncbi:MAG TPA: AMP-binding protein [Stellaceae bacterium]|nr:AMP-binding protein [Stellaceae bacterium]